MTLPAVAANIALTVDGKAAARGGGPTRFTSAADRARMMQLRTGADAVMVGRGTLNADDTALRVSHSDLMEVRLRRGMTPEPVRVVVSASGRLRPSSKVFRVGGAPIVIFTTSAMPMATRLQLGRIADVRVEPRGAKVVDLRRALRELAEDYGVSAVLCEGGPTLLRGLVRGGLLHTLHVTFAPVIFGGGQAPTLLGSAAGSLLDHSTKLNLESFESSGGEVFATYTVRRQGARKVKRGKIVQDSRAGGR